VKLRVKPTGNMTLSILDENDKQVLKIDMLRAKTMKAGFGGNRLAQALNDLALITETVNAEHMDVDLPHPDIGISPRPWVVESDEKKRTLCVKDADGRVIADRRFPSGYDAQRVELLLTAFDTAIRMINNMESSECP
jgi:hypothetical protein